MDALTIETAAIAPVFYDWGALKWLVDDSVADSSTQSFGVVYVQPGKTNPTHWHTEAQEIVHMLQGECDVRTDSGTVTLRPGQTLFIPRGTRHELTNRGWQPAAYVASFSASDRGTLFENPDEPGVKPLC
jgi:quercetin dioxygenase-like cupin family protein